MTEPTKHKKSTIISASSDKPRSEENKHYVSNAELHLAFVDWYAAMDAAAAAGKEEPPIPEKIGRAFIQIATNFAKKANWNNNAKYKSEMIGDAIENCVKSAKKYDINRPDPNPFSYFTQNCYYAFLRRIEFEKIEDYTKHKLTINAIAKNDQVEVENDDEFEIESFDLNMEGIDDFIREFELKHFKRVLGVNEIAGMAGKTKKLSSDDQGFF